MSMMLDLDALLGAPETSFEQSIAHLFPEGFCLDLDEPFEVNGADITIDGFTGCQGDDSASDMVAAFCREMCLGNQEVTPPPVMEPVNEDQPDDFYFDIIDEQYEFAKRSPKNWAPEPAKTEQAVTNKRKTRSSPQSEPELELPAEISGSSRKKRQPIDRDALIELAKPRTPVCPDCDQRNTEYFDLNGGTPRYSCLNCVVRFQCGVEEERGRERNPNRINGALHGRGKKAKRRR